ncbi:MAG: nuclease-related domain-containing protein [Erysipelotrichaceae bacterium]
MRELYVIFRIGIIAFIIGLFGGDHSYVLIGFIMIATSIGVFYSSKYYKTSGNGFLKTFRNKGSLGEFIVYCEIRKLGFRSIFTNVYLPSLEENTTEVDLIALHKTGIYVFEVKNYSGWIYGDEYQKYWTATLNRNTKNQFYNPIRQNYGHIESLKTFINNSNEDVFHSYIVFSLRCELKEINKKSPVEKICLTKQEYLAKVVKNHISTRKEVLMEQEIFDIERILERQCRQSAEFKKNHVENLKKKFEK